MVAVKSEIAPLDLQNFENWLKTIEADRSKEGMDMISAGLYPGSASSRGPGSSFWGTIFSSRPLCGPYSG